MARDEIVVGQSMVQLPHQAAMHPVTGAPPPVAATIHMTRPHWMHPPSIPHGVSMPHEDDDYLGFSSDLPGFAFTATSGTVMNLTAFPQRPFRGTTIIASATYITAAGVQTDASNLVFVNPAISVGAIQIGASQGPIPLSFWGPGSLRSITSWPASGQGTRIFVPLNLQGLTVGAGDKVLVTFGVGGKAVR